MKNALFGIKDGEPLVDLNLEGVAFNLAEIGIDGRVQRYGRCDPILGAQSDVGFAGCTVPITGRRTKLVDRVRDTRKQFD